MLREREEERESRKEKIEIRKAQWIKKIKRYRERKTERKIHVGKRKWKWRGKDDRTSLYTFHLIIVYNFFLNSIIHTEIRIIEDITYETTVSKLQFMLLIYLSANYRNRIRLSEWNQCPPPFTPMIPVPPSPLKIMLNARYAPGRERVCKAIQITIISLMDTDWGQSAVAINNITARDFAWLGRRKLKDVACLPRWHCNLRILYSAEYCQTLTSWFCGAKRKRFSPFDIILNREPLKYCASICIQLKCDFTLSECKTVI